MVQYFTKFYLQMKLFKTGVRIASGDSRLRVELSALNSASEQSFFPLSLASSSMLGENFDQLIT